MADLAVSDSTFQWRAPKWLPGLLVCCAVSLVAVALQAVETRLFGRPWLEALVLAILVGVAVRSVWTPSPRFTPGVCFSAKTLLEIAVALLGASVSVEAVMAAGPALLAGVFAVVAMSIGLSFGLCRAIGLSWRMSTLIACGNSICGNSAIAAVAPVIGADGDEVSASIAFTAILGVIVVLTLPFAVPLLHLSVPQFGVLAGLTVYAVPQVLAATAAVGGLSVQIGALVKLVRVLTLGPVIFAVAALMSRFVQPEEGAVARKIDLKRLAPWFILAFLALAALRSLNLLPAPVLRPTADLASVFTVIAMAALGLQVDLRAVCRVGPKVTAAVTLSLVMLGAISFGLIRLLHVA